MICELAAGGLDRLMIKIKIARRKLTVCWLSEGTRKFDYWSRKSALSIDFMDISAYADYFDFVSSI